MTPPRAAACLLLATACFPPAALAAGGRECGDLADCLRPLASDVARTLGDAARDRYFASGSSAPLAVRFRPARTEPAGVTVYCQALSVGLRNALHGEVRKRGRYIYDYEVRRAERGAVTPPEVVTVWAWDRTGDAREILALDVYFMLSDGRDWHFRGEIPVSTLSARQRACLFSFRPGADWIEAEAPGELMDEPTYRPGAWVADYEAGARLRVLGRLEAPDDSGGGWLVVAWRDPETRERRNLFAAGLGERGRNPAAGGAAR